MPDEPKAPDGAQDTPAPDNSAPDKPRPTDTEQSGSDKKQDMFPRDYVEEIRNEAKQHRKEKEALAKRLADIEKSQKDNEEKKLADDQEWKTLAEKRAKDLDDERAKFQQERLDLLRGNIAARYESRLPKSDNADIDPVAEFAKRLQGSNEDELRADAEKLIAILVPKQPETTQQQPQNPARRQTTTVAPDGTPTGETDEQKRDRLYMRGQIKSPLFDNPKP